MVPFEAHTSVLLKEALYFLDVKPGGKYIDATVGGGGHSQAILKAGGQVLAIDQDPKSLEVAERCLADRACPGTFSLHERTPGAFKLIQGNFSKLAQIASYEGWVGMVYGVLFDLGFASFQVSNPRYGLSFAQEGPLDMRLDKELGVTAGDLVNSLPERELARLFWEYGQERLARPIAKAVVKWRCDKRFETTTELAGLVEEVYAAKRKMNNGERRTGSGLRVHPATKVFLALRVAVNSEFENLKRGLSAALEVLAPGGRLVVVSFHSGEDRIVKNFLRENQVNLDVLTKKPVVPTEQEIKQNRQARSAKLRAAEKL